MTNVTRTEERVITLKEIVDTINTERVANGERKLEHGKQMVKVAELAKEKSFGHVAIKSTCIEIGNGATRDVETYHLTRKQAIAVGAKLDNKRLILIVDKLEELSQPKQLTSLEIMSQMLQAQIQSEKRLAYVEEKIEAIPETIIDVLDDRFDKRPSKGFMSTSELQARYGMSKSTITKIVTKFPPKDEDCHRTIEQVGIVNYKAYGVEDVDSTVRSIMKTATKPGKVLYTSEHIEGSFKITNKDFIG